MTNKHIKGTIADYIFENEKLLISYFKCFNASRLLKVAMG